MRIAPVPVLLVATILGACGDSGVGIVPGPLVIERSVDPAATGAGISNATGQHVVFSAGGSPTGTLVVFLPGTGGRPDFYKRFVRHAAERGHHAIALAYLNSESVNELCASAPSATCQENARIEIITGTPRSDLVTVDAANSIDSRLSALLMWLGTNYPSENWSPFRTNEGVRWDRVIVAGHSQGGGHAAMIARLRLVRRAILFSSTEPAPWTTATFATPNPNLFGFVHRQEDAYPGITASWQLMGFSGSLTAVETASPPFGSHRLYTNSTACRQVAVLDVFHNCVVTDAVTPLDATGQPLFGPVWTFLLEG